MEHCV